MCVATASNSGGIPSTSWPNITQTGKFGSQSKISTARLLVSTAAISKPFLRSSASVAANRQPLPKATRSSAPSAVLAIAFLGGRAVMPLSSRRSKPAPSAVRKNAPTLYMLRTSCKQNACRQPQAIVSARRLPWRDTGGAPSLLPQSGPLPQFVHALDHIRRHLDHIRPAARKAFRGQFRGSIDAHL